jgi:outer membrane receptor protein involved in Fe transport
MRTYVSALLAICLFSACLSAAEVKGKVVDPSGAPIAGAQVSIVSTLGMEAQTTTAQNGAFRIPAVASGDARILVAAPGFRIANVAPGNADVIQLSLAPAHDAVEVVSSPIAVAASDQGGSVSVISNQDIERRNEPNAFDLLRYLPGMAFNQTGSPGGVTSLFLRGGNSNYSLVQIDGVPVNSFGGAFDFAHIPEAALDHIEVIRGPQSAFYGPYANSGVIDFVTRQPEGTQLDLLAEGGTYRERRFAIGGAGTLAGFGIALSATRLDTDGPVANSDYRNENVLLNVNRRFGRQEIGLHADFDSNEEGEPGPYGSNPKHTFTSIDTISHAKNNFSNYFAHYQAEPFHNVRQEVTGSLFLDNSGYVSPYGFSFNKDLRYQGEERTIVSATPWYTVAFGVNVGHEEVKNTYITNASFEDFPVRRNDVAVYLENRIAVGGRLFLNGGVRVEDIATAAIPADGYSRPAFPRDTIWKASPRISAAYLLAPETRAHAAFATGIRPPSGFELAFTNNPALRPERTRSFEAGIEQKVLRRMVALDATYFYNRYYDLIVTLGGSLKNLSHYQTDNLANSRAQGAEFSASLRPARWFFVTGSYTLLQTRILALDGSTGLAPLPFTVGQQLTRRPANSGSAVATFTRGRVAADVTGYFRGRTLYEEPSYGASNGLFWNPGFANVGINLNYSLGRGVTAYGNLRNALNWHYEEVFGFPSPRLNFVAGLKWRLR